MEEEGIGSVVAAGAEGVVSGGHLVEVRMRERDGSSDGGWGIGGGVKQEGAGVLRRGLVDRLRERRTKVGSDSCIGFANSITSGVVVLSRLVVSSDLIT